MLHSPHKAMDTEKTTCERFIGVWTLDVASCQYEQGDPPLDGTYRIEFIADVLHFLIDWTDAEGLHHQVKFSGIPDGQKTEFAGAPLADALSIDNPSSSELHSAAYWQEEELMSVHRTLDARGKTMRVTQRVQLIDGTVLVNNSTYRKNPQA